MSKPFLTRLVTGYLTVFTLVAKLMGCLLEPDDGSHHIGRIYYTAVRILLDLIQQHPSRIVPRYGCRNTWKNIYGVQKNLYGIQKNRNLYSEKS